jgi:uncharacterized protein DUF6893
MLKFSKIVGMVVLAAATIGFLANLPDIKRYVRMSMM